MRRMLVTGAAGFIDANFLRYWLGTYPDDVIVVVDALNYAGNRSNFDEVLSERFSLVECDINDTETIKAPLRDQKHSTIVHFPAESYVDRSIVGPDAFIDANILGTHSLMKAARQMEELAVDGHRFHQVSTDEVYGSLYIDDPAFTKTTTYAPKSPYLASKASSDFLVCAYNYTYDLNVITSNCSNNNGPFHFPKKLIPLIVINLLHGKGLPIYGDGKNIPDWLYVEDHARGIELVLNQGVVGETYSIGGVNELANINKVKLICQLMDERFTADETLGEKYPICPAADGRHCDSQINYVTARAGHDFRYAIDTARIREELGYEPAVDFETGIRRALDLYPTNVA